MHATARFGLRAATRYATPMLMPKLTIEDTQNRTALPYVAHTETEAPHC